MPDKQLKNPRRNPAHAFREIGDEGGLVVVPSDSKVEVLNPVASKIYSMLDGEHSRDQIVCAIVEEFEVDEAAAGRDFDEFLEKLESQKMMAAANGASGDQSGSRNE